MDAYEVQRLAAMATALRPDWSQRSMRTFIEKQLSTRSYADTAVALAWVCTRTRTETPRLLLEAGPWWRATITAGESGYRPPRRGEDCPLHPGQYADACSGCAADRRVGDTTAPADLHRPDGLPALRLARSALAEAKVGQCSHGVPRNACLEHRAVAKAPSA